MRLDRLLSEYCRREGTPLLAHLSLETASDFARMHPDGGRVFDYAVELQIQVAILQLDLSGIARGTDSPPEGETDEDQFCRRMAVLRMNSDYVFRYRAIWDKVMGLLVLLIAPEKFKRFLEAKSRRKEFRKITEQAAVLPEELVGHIIETAQAFDDRYRTAEAHGAGSTRRWVTGEKSEWDSEQANMFWAWNALNRALNMLGAVFRNAVAAAQGGSNSPAG